MRSGRSAARGDGDGATPRVTGEDRALGVERVGDRPDERREAFERVRIGVERGRASEPRRVQRDDVEAGVRERPGGGVEHRAAAQRADGMPEQERCPSGLAPFAKRQGRAAGDDLAEAHQAASSGGSGTGSGLGVGVGRGHSSGFGCGGGGGVGSGRGALGGVPAPRRSSARSASRCRAASLASAIASPTLSGLAQRREAVRDAGGEAGHLLHRLGDRVADGAHGRVGAVGHRHGAVRHRVGLVELVVDAVDGPARLHDHRQQVALGALDEGRDVAEQLAELEAA